MNDFSAVTGLSLMALASAIGFFTSWLPQLRRWVLLALVSVFLMLPLSALLRSITLGWLFGLSLMFLLPVFLLFSIGAVLGHWLSEKDTKNDIESGKVEASIAPVAAGTSLRTSIDAFRQHADGLLIVAGVGAGFAVVIGTGFKISGDPTPLHLALRIVASPVQAWVKQRATLRCPCCGEAMQIVRRRICPSAPGQEPDEALSGVAML